MKIIILAGGGGTRLFPLSRSLYPKQFLKIFSQQTLLQQTVERFRGLVEPCDIVVVTNKDYVFHVEANLAEIDVAAAHVLCEPERRNTAPAIALAAAYCRDVLGCDEDEAIFVAPADHLILERERYQEKVRAALQGCVAFGGIATLGVVPDKPETGFGYIEAAEALTDEVYRVASFREKPDLATAQSYVDSGRYYWNAGMLAFQFKDFAAELAKSAPEIHTAFVQGYTDMLEGFAALPQISVDYAVAEKSRRLLVTPLTGISWNDIGSFDAIADIMGDEVGNSFSGDVMAEDCKNTMILGDKRLIAAIGAEDLLIADTPDALLISRRGRSQDVKGLVERLKGQQRPEAEVSTTAYRPWGSYTVLAEGDGFKVKQINVNPGGKLSLQMHYHRSEHWTVVSGTGKVTLGDKESLLRVNESTYIPVGVKHRLENPGKLTLRIIEVQNGRYLGEDDIVRFDDIYGR